ASPRRRAALCALLTPLPPLSTLFPYTTLFRSTTSLGVLAVPGTRIVVYRPTDELTRDALSRLLAGEGADARYPCREDHQRRKARSAEHTAELQSPTHPRCRLLL